MEGIIQTNEEARIASLENNKVDKSAQGATSLFSQLPNSSTISSSDEIPVRINGAAYKITASAAMANLNVCGKEDLAIIVDGDTASAAVSVGGYAYIRNNTHGLTEGLYTNTSSSAFPASGGTADSTVFTAVSGGGLNAVNNKLTNLLKTKTINGTTDSNGYISLELSTKQVPVWATGTSQSKIIRFLAGVNSGTWGGYALCEVKNTSVTFTCWYLDFTTT